MSEALQYSLNFDASPAVASSKQAAEAIESNFKKAYEQTKATYTKPLQMTLDLRSDAQKKIDAIANASNKVKKEQEQINKKYKLAQKLQDKVRTAVKGTKAEKEKVLKLVKRLQRNTNLTAKEMQTLRGHARKLVDSLVKASQVKIDAGGENLGQSFFNASLKATLAYKAIQLVGDAIKGTISTGIKMETLNLQLEAFTGSAQGAEMAMRKFADIATKSPLNVIEVAEAGKIMMAFGLSTSEAADATEQLAIISAATGGEMNNLARNLGQIQAQGRAYTRDITQFAMQGIPIWEQLSKVTGRSVVELKKMAEEGEIGFQSVSAAIRDMTREGTAFAEIAERMQETYAGRLARLESDFQQAAGEIITQISRIDEQIGLSEKVLKLLGAGAKFLSESLGGIAPELEASNYQANIMRASVARVTERTKEADDAVKTWAQRVLGIDLNPFKSAAGTVEQVKRETAGARIAAEQWDMTLGELTEKLRTMLLSGDPSKFVPEFQAVAQEVGIVSEKLEEQQREYLKLQGITAETMVKAIIANEEKKNAVKDALQAEMLAYENMKTSAQQAYNDIKASAESTIAASEQKIKLLQKEIDRTKELGPAGRQLEAIKMRELRYTARTGLQLKNHISERKKNKLQAQATLEKIAAQEKAEALAKQQARERSKIQAAQNEMRQAEKELNKEMLRIQKLQQQSQEKFNGQLEKLNTTLEALNRALGGDILSSFDVVVKEAGKIAPETSKATAETNILNGKIQDTGREYDALINKLDIMATKIRNMPRLPSGTPSNFAGGPISAGEKSIVNELGKEAFLSASGKLSMINAPAWGEWRAPSSGTIIPAHLTKQLNIPTGGINLNKAPGKGASVGKAVKTIQTAAGDTFNQNVTIQAANPVQAANNIMVNMLRQRRMRRR